MRTKFYPGRTLVSPTTVVLLLWSVLLLAPLADAQSAAEGQTIYTQKCAVCHSTEGQLAPLLQGITQRRDPAWLKRYLDDPAKVLAEGDPELNALFQQYRIPMPDPGLNGQQIESVIAYLQQGNVPASLAAGLPETPAQPGIDPRTLKGDPNAGRAIFEGNQRLTNGGAPCIACHSVQGTGVLGGGALGPDLTDVVGRYGDGLYAVLGNTPFPRMQPIYQARPITPQEQADLMSFFEQHKGGQATSNLGTVVYAVVIGCALIALIAPFTWRRRLQGTHRQLVEASREKGNNKKGNKRS